jgi:hypothetical protein
VTYCPEHDPILVAGYNTCTVCGATSYPTDADWMGEELILATFATACRPNCPRQRNPGRTVLLELGADPAIPEVQRPRLCRAIASTTGRPCRGYAQPGSGYCHTHNPARRP